MCFQSNSFHASDANSELSHAYTTRFSHNTRTQTVHRVNLLLTLQLTFEARPLMGWFLPLLDGKVHSPAAGAIF
jgi:hypothetical protein